MTKRQGVLPFLCWGKKETSAVANKKDINHVFCPALSCPKMACYATSQGILELFIKYHNGHPYSAKQCKTRQIASIKSSKNGSKPLMNYYQHFTRMLDTLDEIFRRNRRIQYSQLSETNRSLSSFLKFTRTFPWIFTFSVINFFNMSITIHSCLSLETKQIKHVYSDHSHAQ